MKTYTFHVVGMHCKACVLLTESELVEHPNVSSVKSMLKTHTVEIRGDFADMPLPSIAKELTGLLEKHGYSLSVERQAEARTKARNWADFKIAVPIALAFAVLFVLLQKVGIANLANASTVSYGTAFVIGVIASLSTCMAVVGGLVLSMSATFAKEGEKRILGASQEVVDGFDQPGETVIQPEQHRYGEKVRPQLLFHIGRLASFFVLGGIIGVIGSVFTLNATVTAILSVVIGIVMLILGINLLDIFHGARRFQLSMPRFLSKHALGISALNHTLIPLLVGIATFFLPCGFTQSMQLYTLTTGTFLTGGFTMLAFAFGTLPVLALLSFSSFSIQNSAKAGVFFKTAGLVVILFALFNLTNSMVVIDLIPPLFNF